MESFTLRSGATAVIDYAHTPDAYDKVLSTIKDMVVKPGFLHIVFGCGGDRDKTKRAQMAACAERFGYYCYVTPDNPRTEKLTEITEDILAVFVPMNTLFLMSAVQGYGKPWTGRRK
ncbi:MAG: hypothetical protein CM1200mP10_30960 [Candidatus Neomarinimicrobiota bacterium]|nr:MAG: hypothetical protein CM1200mP10_30960 [Candidatus Neomarinimicrobiota bacterium]